MFHYVLFLVISLEVREYVQTAPLSISKRFSLLSCLCLIRFCQLQSKVGPTTAQSERNLDKQKGNT